jgi:ChrR Cupin-like domain
MKLPKAQAGLPADTGSCEETRRRVRRRLMDRVADADHSHVTIAPNQGLWMPFADGVKIKVLRDHAGVLTYFLRLDAGAVLPAHRHPQDEECLILKGRIRVGSQEEMGPGSYHLAHKGALHATISTQTGATIFLRGAMPGPDHALT